MAFFDIIIPVYNVKNYLEECLRSVLQQSFRDFQVILVDDGSTDGSGALCDGFAAQDNRVRVVHKTNGGASSARNLGLAEARGEYILFLDADDYLLSPAVLESLAQRLTRTKADVLIYDSVKEKDGKQEAPYFAHPDMPSQLSAQQSRDYVVKEDLWTACPWNKVVKSDLYEGDGLRFREGITSEDIDWCLRLAMAVKRFDYIDLCAVSYRQWEGSVTGTATVEKTRCLLENIRYCLELWKQGGEDPSLKAYLAYQYGTLLVNISQLPGSQERRELEKQAKTMTHMLKWSDQSKIRLLRIANRCVGFRLMLKLLKIKFG